MQRVALKSQTQDAEVTTLRVYEGGLTPTP